jgi:hypothetical protein
MALYKRLFGDITGAADNIHNVQDMLVGVFKSLKLRCLLILNKTFKDII